MRTHGDDSTRRGLSRDAWVSSEITGSSMRITIFDVSGCTGRLVVDQTQVGRHYVTVILRNVMPRCQGS